MRITTANGTTVSGVSRNSRTSNKDSSDERQSIYDEMEADLLVRFLSATSGLRKGITIDKGGASIEYILQTSDSAPSEATKRINVLGRVMSNMLVGNKPFLNWVATILKTQGCVDLSRTFSGLYLEDTKIRSADVNMAVIGISYLRTMFAQSTDAVDEMNTFDFLFNVMRESGSGIDPDGHYKNVTTDLDVPGVKGPLQFEPSTFTSVTKTGSILTEETAARMLVLMPTGLQMLTLDNIATVTLSKMFRSLCLTNDRYTKGSVTKMDFEKSELINAYHAKWYVTEDQILHKTSKWRLDTAFEKAGQPPLFINTMNVLNKLRADKTSKELTNPADNELVLKTLATISSQWLVSNRNTITNRFRTWADSSQRVTAWKSLLIDYLRENESGTSALAALYQKNSGYAGVVIDSVAAKDNARNELPKSKTTMDREVDKSRDVLLTNDAESILDIILSKRSGVEVIDYEQYIPEPMGSTLSISMGELE
jgi:hypothetical protein